MVNSVKKTNNERRSIFERFYTLYHKKFHPDIVLIASNGNKLYINKKDIGVAPALINGGIFDQKETEVIFNILKPGMIVADVGANVGYFTLIAAKLVEGKGKVYAFEPQPDNFRLLAENVRINGYHNVTLVNKAMADKPGNLTLFVDKVNLGAHSFSDKNLIEKAGQVEVKTTTLDNFFSNIDRIDVIKMDTQGAEGLIIHGADKVLRRPGLKLIIEFWPWGLRSVGTDPIQLLEKLKGYGFKITVIDEANQSLKNMSFNELVKACDQMNNGWGFFNLLLEKS